MNEADRYFFDLNGWIRVPAVFSLEQVDQMNAAIDEHLTPASTIHRDRPVAASAEALQGDPASGAHRIDHFGFLAWPAPAGELFRQMLAHPKLVPYLQGLCGQGYRMDHDCPMITMEQGAPGGGLHGGGGSFDPLQYYVWDGASQSMHNGLIVVALQLSDTAEGDGGLAVVSGSHKANLPMPTELADYQPPFDGVVRNPAANRGDVLIFTEALTHGTLPWRPSHQRRSILYRFIPGSSAYMAAYGGIRRAPIWPAAMTDGMTEAQLAVVEPPYHNRLGRPMVELDEEGEVVVVEGGGESVAQLKADVAALLDGKETDEAAKAGRAKELVGFALERGMHTAQGGAAAINQVEAAMEELRGSRGDGGSAEKQRLLLAAFEAGALSAAEYGVAVARASKL